MARSPNSDWLARTTNSFEVPRVEQRVLAKGAFRAGSSMRWVARSRRASNRAASATEWPRPVPAAIQR
jgi:hypothetical protein